MASEDLPANGHGGPADPAKRDLRRTFRAARAAYVAALAPGERDLLEAALADVLAHHLPPDGRIAGYHAIGSEIGLGALVRPLLLPRVNPAAPLSFHRGPAVAGPVVPGLGRLVEPPADAHAADPDIVLVPLLACDGAGTRLGQGGGHYDRTLAALRARRRILAVGVGWDIQAVDRLPSDPWDAPLDALATPSGWRDFAVG
ncbi:MAG: 5-formyltetrahydrofolate cyclo-ligase, partial [Sphingomonadaceae bacterium]|nr:5-formyltetrahydrofolate cyclo-ligase [Sphingomonadaceae bacterium]